MQDGEACMCGEQVSGTLWIVARLALIVIDGFGVAPPGPGNARLLAKMPTVARLEREVPHFLMQTSGNAAGLPEGQQGGSEPGHLVIGAGRIVWQPQENINQAIKNGSFFSNKVLVDACKRAKANRATLHLEVIFSTGGVHGHIDHLIAMMELAKRCQVSRVLLHLVGDGRDMPEQQFCEDFAKFQAVLNAYPSAKVASLVGRYFAMDRDEQYATRTKVAYDLYALGAGEECDDLCRGAKAWYAKAPSKEKTDYYIRPLKTKDFQPMRPGDTVVLVNFRSDREIQIMRMLSDKTFHDCPRPVLVKDVVCMGPYSPTLPVAFPQPVVAHNLGSIVSEAGIRQLRIAESDKFAHVTFFFNSQIHEPYHGEDRIKIESPKVPNFAEAPAMSVFELADEMVRQVESGKYGFIVVNIANPDLVGHGGMLQPAIEACEAVDQALGKMLVTLDGAGYDWIVTSDHGNIEQMFYPNGEVCPSHTVNPVQTFVHSSLVKSSKDLKGMTGLKDIAPLCLRIMDLPIPKEMQEGKV